MPATPSFDVAKLRDQFNRDGYLALEGFFPVARIDSVLASIDELLAKRAGEIVVDSLKDNRRSFWADAAEPEARRFKFNDLYLLSPEVRELAMDKPLSALLSALLDEPAVLCNSLNFQKGSNQPKHIDSLFMTPQTPEKLLATWTALEDAHPDSGPLVYFPGSHRIPLYTFKDGTHHASPPELPAWTAYMDEELRKRNIVEQRFLARKGDVFIWHSDLVHGGSPIKDQGRTRNSLVCHYYGEADSRRVGSRLAPIHHGYWMQRLRAPVTVSPEVFGPGRPFPEADYLDRYADIKAAVAAGTCPSGFTHYQAFGYKEGRGV